MLLNSIFIVILNILTVVKFSNNLLARATILENSFIVVRNCGV
jgi:hypothetical protein